MENDPALGKRFGFRSKIRRWRMAYRFRSVGRGGVLGFIGRTFQMLILGLGPRMTAIGLILIAGAWLYASYGPRAPHISPVRRHMAESLAREAVRQFPWDRDVGTVFMAPVQGDWGAFLTDTLRRQILESGRFRLAPEPATRRMLNDLHIYPDTALDEDRVRRLLRDIQEDTLLLVRLRSYEEDRRAAIGELNCVFIGKKSGAVLPVNVFKELRKGFFNLEYRLIGARLSSFGRRLFFWFVSVLAFPLVVLPLTRAVTRRRNPTANLVLVSLYSTLLIAWSVVAIGPVEQWWQGLMMIGVSLVVIGYVLFSCNALAALDGASGGGPPTGRRAR